MKWILLMLLVACGKHEEPKALDTRDSDGDQVLNYEETDDDRYIAQYKNLGSMKGTLKIIGHDSISFPFSNEVKDENGLDLFVKNALKIEKGFFYEWSNLNLIVSDRPDLSKLMYKVQLNFHVTDEKADEVIFILNNQKHSIGTWKNYMEFFLTKEDLESLLQGRGFLQVKKKQWKSEFFDESSEETIRKKTSRVFLYDGQVTRSYYVSKVLTLEQILNRFKIDSTSSINEDDLPFGTTTPEKKWFLRIVDDQYFLVYSSTEEIRRKFLENFRAQTTTLRRDNGTPSTAFNFGNTKNSRIYFRMKSIENSSRHFVESSEVRRYGGHEDKYECRHHFRTIQSESIGHPDISTLLQNLTASFQLDELTYDIDEQGESWKKSLINAPENSTISFISRPQNTYTVTGEYYNGCGNDHRNAYYNTNVEGKFTFVLESYVEKI